MALNPIEILINAKDQASGVFDRLNNKLKVIGVAVAGYFGVKAFAGVVQGAADFEQALSRIQAVTGATAGEMAQLKKAAEDAGATTKFTSTEAAAALENLGKAGLSAGDALKALPAVLSLAEGGGVGLAEAAGYVTKAVSGMGLSFDEAGRVADVLAMGARSADTDVVGLAQALSYAAPTANSLGVSLESTVAIIGQFANAGIDASRAGTALNSIMSQFADPASKFRGELAAIGITTGDFNKALHQLADAGGNGAKAINSVGLEAGPALKALLNKGMPALDELKAKLDNSAGAAAEAAKVMSNNLNGSMTGLASAWDTVKNVLGTPVLPVLKDGVDKLATAFRTAVSDGTVQKFGEAIAIAFQSGITWIKAFAAEIDFTKLTADLQAFAARTGEVFTQIGEYATNAGNIVKLVYGVMSAGTNAVLGAIYGIGSAFAGVASNIQSGLALIYDAFAKVTFGKVSAAYKQAADEIRLSANATMAASEELGKKSATAFLSVADGAQLARDGFGGLATSATGAATAVGATKSTLDAVAASMGAQGVELVKLRAEYDALANGGGMIAAADKLAQITALLSKGGPEAKAHAEAIGKLRAEYDALVSGGNIDAARDKLQEIARALAGQATAADVAWAAIRKLEAEHAALVASGNLTEANNKLAAISKALKDMEPAAAGAVVALDGVAKASGAAADAAKKLEKDQKDAAAALASAFRELGVTTSAELTKMAATAKTQYELIKGAATSTAQDIASAFAAYAEKAIAANGGVADAAIKAEAAMRGFKVEVDEAGKNTVKLASAADAASVAFAKASEAIKAKVTAMRAESELLLSSLDLRKSQIDASIAIAQAQGKETEVIRLKVEQKRIEIRIIQETVKAQIAEAEASIATTKAKMSELAANGSLTESKRAELQAQIKASEASINGAKARGQSVRVLEQEIAALQGSSKSYDKNASSIDKTTAALERLNKEKEREIAVLEKANELKEREDALYRKKWNIDKEGFTLNTNGQRAEQTIQSKRSVFEQAKGAGLDEKKALAIADRFIDDLGRYTGWSSTSGMTWQETLQKAIDEELMKMARNKAGGSGGMEKAQPAPAAPARSLPMQTPAQQQQSAGREQAQDKALYDAKAAAQAQELKREQAHYQAMRGARQSVGLQPVDGAPVGFGDDAEPYVKRDTQRSAPTHQQDTGRQQRQDDVRSASVTPYQPITINLAAGVNLSDRAQVDALARQLMPAIESLNRKGAR